jgi:hypothetical protein
MARRTKYTPATLAKIIQSIELGATYEIAAGYAGITPSTFYDWKANKAEFSEAINEAEGKAATKWLAKIEQDPSWQSSAWKLERRYPHQYGKTVQEQQHTGKDGAPLVININRVTKRGD